MNFQEAVRKSIKQYFDGKEGMDHRKAIGTRGKNKRDKKYFDKMEVELGLKESQEEVDEGNA